MKRGLIVNFRRSGQAPLNLLKMFPNCDSIRYNLIDSNLDRYKYHYFVFSGGSIPFNLTSRAINLINKLKNTDKKIIGFCYGMQLIAHSYGLGPIPLKKSRTNANKKFTLHGNELQLKYNHNFYISSNQVSKSKNLNILNSTVSENNEDITLMMENNNGNIIGFQGHPENSCGKTRDVFLRYLRLKGYI